MFVMKIAASLLALTLLATTLGAPVASANHCGPQTLVNEAVCIALEWYVITVGVAFALLGIDWVAVALALAGLAIGITFCVLGEKPILQAAQCA